MRKIKVIIKRTDRPTAYTACVANGLKNLQNSVGGYIEVVTLATDFVIICNEEGRIKNLPYNCTIRGCDFYGDIIFAGVDGEDFADVPITLQQLKELFPGVSE